MTSAPCAAPDHNLFTHAGWTIAEVYIPALDHVGGAEEPGAASEEHGHADAARMQTPRDGQRPNARLWTTTSGHSYLQTRTGTISMAGDRVVRPAGVEGSSGSSRDRAARGFEIEPPVRAGFATWGEPPF